MVQNKISVYELTVALGSV